MSVGGVVGVLALKQPGRFVGMGRTRFTLRPVLVRLLDHLNRGVADKESARLLGLTLGTVRTYVDQLKQQCGTRDRFEVVQRARKAGMMVAPKPDAAFLQLFLRRERRCLEYLQRGFRDQALAHALRITLPHLRRLTAGLLRKLGVRSADEAVARAIAVGLLDRRGTVAAEAGLVPLDRRILRGLARGRTQAKVARDLGITASAVTIRLNALRAGWAARDVYDLLAMAKERGVFAKGVELPARSTKDIIRKSHLRVLQLFNRGLASQEVADRLGLGAATVRTYASKLYEHFGVATRQQLVLAARDRGILMDPRLAANKRARQLYVDPVTVPRLSRRQLEALQFARRDCGPAEIARAWKTSQANAEDALAMARKKLGVRTTPEAVERAISLNLLGPLLASVRSPFSRREREVLLLLARGLSRQEIGSELGIKRLTASSYVANMRHKVRARSDDELLEVAERLGALGPRRVSRRRMQGVHARGLLSLTARQLEVAHALCLPGALTHAQIAQRLGITKATVSTHVRVLKLRLNLRRSSYEEFRDGFRRLLRTC